MRSDFAGVAYAEDAEVLEALETHIRECMALMVEIKAPSQIYLKFPNQLHSVMRRTG